MSDPAARPWWRDWRGVPPSWDYRTSAPLSSQRVWLLRLVWSTLLVAGAFAAAQGWRWGFGWLAVLAFQLLVMPSWHRRQVLGLAPRSPS